MRFRIRKTDWVILMIALLVFQDPLSMAAPGFVGTLIGYFDETFALLMLVYLILVSIKRKVMPREGKKPFLLMVFMVLLGLLVGSLKGYQSFGTMLIDGFLCLKFPITYYGMVCYLEGEQRSCPFEDVINYRRLKHISKTIIIVLFTFILANYMFGLFDRGEIRYGIPSQKLFFSHMTVLAATGVILAALITLTSKKNKTNAFIFVLSCLIVVSTLRSKAIAWVGLAFILYFAAYYTKIKNRTFLFCVLALVVLALGYSQLEYYYLDGLGSTSRGIMLKDAFELANHNVFGTGLASFGSYMSREHYSPLYYTLNYTNIWGLSPTYPAFLCDNFLATIIGQFGWPGLLVIVYYFISLYRDCKMNRDNQNKYVSALMIVAYLVITSFGETSIFNSYAVLFGIVLSVCSAKDKH